MSTKHTPGPWSLSEETLRDGLKSKLVHGIPEGMIAIVRVEHQGAYYGDANARLIAAAPDLLEAVRATRALVSEAAATGFNWSDGDWAERLYGNQAVLSAAIAKAEGRQ